MMTYGWRSSTHNAVYFTTTKLGVYMVLCRMMSAAFRRCFRSRYIRYFDAFALMLRN